jgi:hypothetical protein
MATPEKYTERNMLEIPQILRDIPYKIQIFRNIQIPEYLRDSGIYRISGISPNIRDISSMVSLVYFPGVSIGENDGSRGPCSEE